MTNLNAYKSKRIIIIGGVIAIVIGILFYLSLHVTYQVVDGQKKYSFNFFERECIPVKSGDWVLDNSSGDSLQVLDVLYFDNGNDMIVLGVSRESGGPFHIPCGTYTIIKRDN